LLKPGTDNGNGKKKEENDSDSLYEKIVEGKSREKNLGSKLI